MRCLEPRNDENARCSSPSFRLRRFLRCRRRRATTNNSKTNAQQRRATNANHNGHKFNKAEAASSSIDSFVALAVCVVAIDVADSVLATVVGTLVSIEVLVATVLVSSCTVEGFVGVVVVSLSSLWSSVQWLSTTRCSSTRCLSSPVSMQWWIPTGLRQTRYSTNANPNLLKPSLCGIARIFEFEAESRVAQRVSLEHGEPIRNFRLVTPSDVFP